MTQPWSDSRKSAFSTRDSGLPRNSRAAVQIMQFLLISVRRTPCFRGITGSGKRLSWMDKVRIQSQEDQVLLILHLFDVSNNCPCCTCNGGNRREIIL